MAEKKRIVIIGAGGAARETRFVIEQINSYCSQYEFLGYVISDLKKISPLDSEDKIIGDFKWLGDQSKETYVAIGIGEPSVRKAIASDIKAKYPRVIFPILIHPNVVYDANMCYLEEGVVIGPSCILTANIKIGRFSWLNKACILGHEAEVGEGCVLNPTTTIGGGVTLGDAVLVGSGAQVLQYLNVGDCAAIGAGACVTKDVEAGVTVAGIPAKPITNKRAN